MDRILGQRLAERDRTAQRALLEEMGVGSKKELAELLKAQREAAEANKTELERTVARYNDEITRAQEERTSLADERHTLNVERALIDAGARGDLADLSLLVRVEKGADKADIAAAVEALKGKYQVFFQEPTAPLAPSEPTGGGAPARPSNAPDARSQGEARAARYNPPEGKRASFI